MSDNDEGLFVNIRALMKGAPIGLAMKRKRKESSVSYTYVKGEVVECISNPADYVNRTYKDLQTGETLGRVYDYLAAISPEDPIRKDITNDQIASFIPANSILVYVGAKNTDEAPTVAYPFFPSHISLPLKPGETVWLLEESKGQDSVFYYWMCRVAGERQIEDLNYTNFDRSDEVRELDAKFKEQGRTGKVEEERLIIAAATNEKFGNLNLPNDVTVSSIQGGSIAYNEEFVAEPVPRTFKKCSDLVLQGSNNTTIQLTTEKFRNKEDIKSPTFISSTAMAGKNTHTPLAGTIDLFVGKEKSRLKELEADLVWSADYVESSSQENSFNIIKSKRLPGNQSLEGHEASKIDEYVLGKENKKEGNDSPRNVFARMYLGMNSAPDTDFEFSNTDFEDSHQVGASAVMYANHGRIFAENSIRAYNFAGNSLIDMSEDGTITLQSGEGDTAAKLILRPDGNIVIKPGSSGVLYLGGDESEDAGVAVSINTESTPLDGQTVPGSPILPPPIGGIQTSMGGQAFLGDAVSGHSSSKVLIKI